MPFDKLRMPFDRLRMPFDGLRVLGTADEQGTIRDYHGGRARISMDQVLGLRCTICGAEYEVGEVEYVCPEHGDDGILDVVYNYSLIRHRISPERLAADRATSIWRYLPLLPVEPEKTRQLVQGTVLDSVGWTPLYPAPRLAAEVGLRDLWIKDDGREPTASFKDRASAIAIARTRELGYEVVTTASTGNAAAALSGLCAAIEQPNVIFVPRTAPQAKIAQLLVYGATGTAGERHLRRRVRAVPGGRPGVWLVQPQHGLQPLYERGKKDGGL